jgi:hypothetical protein
MTTLLLGALLSTSCTNERATLFTMKSGPRETPRGQGKPKVEDPGEDIFTQIMPNDGSPAPSREEGEK